MTKALGWTERRRDMSSFPTVDACPIQTKGNSEVGQGKAAMSETSGDVLLYCWSCLDESIENRYPAGLKKKITTFIYHHRIGIYMP
jgi:hypothetical protein